VSAPRRPVLRYHGGKWRLAPWIISHFPPHRVYVEPFGGAASVLLRKQPAALVDVYNELDGEIVNLFRVLRDPDLSVQLCDAITLTPYARAEFALSYELSTDPVEQARRTAVRAYMGFGSDSASGARTGFRANGNRQNMHPARDWIGYPKALALIVERLRGVVIENRDASDCMRQHDASSTLHYVDPPYIPDSRSVHTRRSGKGYRHELTAAEHESLAAALHDMAGMVVLSGYDSDLYRALYDGWRRSERAARADAGLYRTEVLWLNPGCARALTAGTAA